MSVNITTFYVQQYAKILNQLVQQHGSRLRASVTEQMYVGKAGSPVEQVGAVAMQPVSTRYAPMGRVDAPTDRRWVYPSDFDLPQLFDHFDKLRLLIDPKSTFVTNAMDAANRQIDDLIISALFGTAKTGETGQNSTAFLAGNVVSVQQGAAAPTGLTVAKLREGVRLLRTNEAVKDGEEIYCVAGARQIDNLLAEAQVVSTDFNSTPVLVNGTVTHFMGCNIIRSERLPTGTDDVAGQSTKVGLYTKAGMHLGVWGDITTSISQRFDLQGIPWQAYVYATLGSTRLEEKRCIQIWAR